MKTKNELSNNSKIIKNTGALYFRTFITMVISFFTARVTLEVLGVNNFGLNNLVGGVVAMFSFLNLSMGTSVQRFYSIGIGECNIDSIKKIFGVGMYIHILIAMISLLIAEVFAFFFLSKLNIPPERIYAAHLVFQFSIAGLILSIINVPYSALLRAKEDFSKMAVVDIIQAFSKLVVLYLLYHIKFDKLITFSALYFCVGVFYFVAIKFLANKYEVTKFYINRDIKMVKEMLSYAVLILVAVFARIFRDQAIIILINLFFGVAINAAYAIALAIRAAIENFTSNFKQSVVPQIMSSYGENNLDRMHKLIFTSTKITFLLSLIISLPLIFETEYILKIWLVKPPLYSVGFVSLLLVDFIINTFPYFLTQGIQATGKLRKIQTYLSLMLILNAVLIYIFLKFGFGFYYVIYLTIIASIVSNILNIIFAVNILKIDIKFFVNQVLLKCVIIIGIITFILVGIQFIIPESLLRLITITTISSLLICGLGYFVGLDKDEKTFVLKYICEIKLKVASRKRSQIIKIGK